MSQTEETAGSLFAKMLRAREAGAPQGDVEVLRQELGGRIERQLGGAATALSIEEKFRRAGHRPENKLCDHGQYSFATHGRHCLQCGTCMFDAGD